MAFWNTIFQFMNNFEIIYFLFMYSKVYRFCAPVEYFIFIASLCFHIIITFSVHLHGEHLNRSLASNLMFFPTILISFKLVISISFWFII